MTDQDPKPQAQPVDYDHDLDRFLANQTATRLFSTAGDLHEPVAAGLHRRVPSGRVLDLGGGNGLLARRLQERGMTSVVLDQAGYVATAPRPVLRADARAIPCKDHTFDAVAALWMLYHVTDPVLVLEEAARVLRPGGFFVACAPSRYNDPEFRTVLPGWGRRSTFDAEDAAATVGRVFDVVEAEYWDAPLISLPSTDAVATFLRGRGMTAPAASAAAGGYAPPVTVTKRGVLVWARVR
jgi:SAM-dependent methyltransferase